MPRGNPQNLIKPTKDQTAEERQESARKAGQASGVARRRKRSLQEVAQMVLQLPSTDPKVIAAMDAAGIPEDARTTATEMVLAVANKTKSKGDHEALKVLRDTAGEVPIQRVAVATTDDLRTLSEADLRAALDGASSD